MSRRDINLIWETYADSFDKPDTSPSDDVDQNELKQGIADEKEEHGLTDEEAEKVARDHLTKVDAKYYSKLKAAGL